MKQFFRYMLATICGIIALLIICGIFMMISFASMIASSSAPTKAKENSVFVLKMDGMVSERTEGGSPLDQLLGQVDMTEMGLDDIVAAIRKAKNNENIKGIYLEGGTTIFDAPATAQQVRDALADFKKSGKWILAFADRYTQGSYYVCSVADSIFMDRQGMIDFKGLGGKNYYMTGLYEKIGITYQATRVGKYKSAVESVTRKDMSENDREQRTAYLQGIWKLWLKQMAESRNVTPDQLNQLADDSIMAFANIADYKAAKLIDDAIFPEKIKEIVKGKLGLGEDDDINQLTLSDMTNLQEENKKDGDKIAVYYAYGEIIDEEASAFASEHAIVGKETVEDLNELAKDDDVKAVVLRVNSPGGSAIASEHIWHAIKQLKEKKPVVVSMGGYAASGGYMISAPASYIFAEPTTVTGSIGIFGLVPNMSELVSNKLGITWDGVSTNHYSDYETRLIFDKNNADVIRFMQGYVDRGYDSFLTIVADGRGMTKEQVNEIAQGRVWIASDAVGIKLVDKLGSLDDAIKKAAELAKLDKYYTAPYPGKTDWFEALLESTDKKGSYLDAEMQKTLGELYTPIMEMRRDQQRNRLQARLPFVTGI
ncbi:signal peptide peptidase SppA [Prevotella sp. E13-17]|uniref:signal peptide peptidase SppA n=1 Tax=Prevotella sp. E13-17 TaxID=2913616 RepID=UPI001EDA2A85|nr:signal peptide peptidase SppA [Prevotella sp. E13-17]UKK51645.1 signal peptide peptidase SppA [Prevotella sp. E13-17]